MKHKLFYFFTVILISSCASVPLETVQLSQAIDADLVTLNTEHKKLVGLYFDKLESDINSFINEVYVPYVIHSVLKKELDGFQNNQGGTIFDAINNAADSLSKKNADQALSEMSDFQEAANHAISQKRTELLTPILEQRKTVTANINRSFDNIERASMTLTNYLKSMVKLKETQETAMSKIGLQNADQYITAELLKTSSLIDKALQTGRQIDVKSDLAINKIEAVSKSIKKLTQKSN